MKDGEQELMKRWVDTWRQAGPELERIRREELRAFDYAAHQAIIDGMLEWACAHSEPRVTSGLVQQQALFSRLRRAG